MARRVLAGGVEHQSATVKCRAAASVSSITSSALNGAGGSTIRAKLLAADLVHDRVGFTVGGHSALPADDEGNPI